MLKIVKPKIKIVFLRLYLYNYAILFEYSEMSMEVFFEYPFIY